MNLDDHDHPNGDTCPKRVWVMTALSDDEAAVDADGLSQGIRLHLASCESCRKLADQLLGVGSALRQMSAAELDGDLASRADAQAMEALRAGGRLTGRVDIPDEPEPSTEDSPSRGWRPPRRYAMAAAILLAVGVYFTIRSGDAEQSPPIQQDQVAAESSNQDPGRNARPDASSPSDPDAPASADKPDGDSPGAAVADKDGATDESAVCQHRTHLEAAMCEKNHALHRVTPLPGRRPRPARAREPLEGPMNAIDKSSPKGSTKDRRRN